MRGGPRQHSFSPLSDPPYNFLTLIVGEAGKNEDSDGGKGAADCSHSGCGTRTHFDSGLLGAFLGALDRKDSPSQLLGGPSGLADPLSRGLDPGFIK